MVQFSVSNSRRWRFIAAILSIGTILAVVYSVFFVDNEENACRPPPSSSERSGVQIRLGKPFQRKLSIHVEVSTEEITWGSHVRLDRWTGAEWTRRWWVSGVFGGESRITEATKVDAVTSEAAVRDSGSITLPDLESGWWRVALPAGDHNSMAFAIFEVDCKSR